MMPLMRLFVALWVPDTVRSELAEALAPIRDQAPGLAWVAPEQWHLTLAFLGGVPADKQDELAARLARAAARHSSLRLRLAGGGRFGDRVLYAKVEGDQDCLRRLAASVGAAARRCGIVLEDRPFRAHLTLARSRTGADLRPLASALGQVTTTWWTADTVALVESRLGQGEGRRAVYDTVAQWPLT